MTCTFVLKSLSLFQLLCTVVVRLMLSFVSVYLQLPFSVTLYGIKTKTADNDDGSLYYCDYYWQA